MLSIKIILYDPPGGTCLHHQGHRQEAYSSSNLAINELNDGYEDCSPGPKYNMFGTGIKTKTLSYSPSKFRRTMINEGTMKTPGPSDYNPEKKHQGTKVSFAQSERKDELSKNNNPDPAFYKGSSKQTKPKIAEYSMGAKYPSIMDDTGKNPGPGDYETLPTKTSQFLETKKSKFGTSPRFSQPNLNPGVGNY